MGWGMNVYRTAQEMAAAIDAIKVAQAALKSDMSALSAGATENQMTALIASATVIDDDLAVLAEVDPQ